MMNKYKHVLIFVIGFLLAIMVVRFADGDFGNGIIIGTAILPILKELSEQKEDDTHET